jgi:hypothetical protein
MKVPHRKIGEEMFNLRSLAYRTDLALLAFQGRVENRGDYIFAASPDNPGFFWGNLLVMRNPPREGDFDKWMACFQKEFDHEPLVRHVTFAWDSVEAEEGITKPFVENGFEIEKSVVLSMKFLELVVPAHSRSDLEVRPLFSDKDWEAALENQIACRDAERFEENSYRSFKLQLMKKYRAMSKAGLGQWFGAFLGDKLVGDCGIFVFDGVGRFQTVGTHPEFRRLGVCGNLVYQSAHYSFTKGGAHTLVMVADPDYHAAKVYQSVGFRPTEQQIGMRRFPKEEWR